MTFLFDTTAKRAIDLACDLQQIPSPTFHEERKAEIIRQRFQSLNLDEVKRDETGNILARFPGAGLARPLIFSAHMDTVFPEAFPLTLNYTPHRVIGPGIGDNSLGLASLLLIPDLLRGSHVQPKGDVWLTATTCEEGLGNLHGIRAVAERFGSSPFAYVSIEGMGLGNILHRGLGVERYRVTINTPGGHSWVNYGEPSAVHELTRLASQLSELRLPKKPRTTFNIGIIQGGTSINTIASTAWMELDLRSENANQLADLSNRVRSQVESAKRPGVEVIIERIGHRPSGELDRTHPLITKTSAILEGLGLSVTLDIASTEANLPLSLGYPAITIGMTTGDHAHTANEYINTAPVGLGLKQILTIIERIWD
jgi:tripeptide aminopeptidase